MGLASSQARLLNLTVRMHQIEYKAARLEAMKLQMANESRQVYETYLDALDRTKVQYKVINTDGSVTYRDIKSYKEDFLDAGYAIDFKGLVYDGDTYITNSSGEAIKYDSTAFEKVSLGTSDVDATTKKLTAAGLAKITSKGYTGTAYSTSTVVQVPIDIYIDKADTTKAYAGDAVKTLNFAQLCHDAFGAELDPAYTTPTLKTPLEDIPYVMTNLINSGDVTIVEYDKKEKLFHQETFEFFGDFETSVATNTGLQEVSDEVLLKKAEAQYEADMKRIDMKDRRYDHELSAIENERNAIKQEMETLKTVSKDNVERTFKLFS